MTLLAPGFLAALIALPILLALGWLARRPRRLLVPSTEIWAEVAKHLDATPSGRAKPALDARLVLSLLAVITLTFAAADCGFSQEKREPRTVRVLIDRSMPMGVPMGDGAAETLGDSSANANTAFLAAIEWLETFADSLDARDSLAIEFAPALPPEMAAQLPLASAPVSKSPRDLATELATAVRDNRLTVTDRRAPDWPRSRADLAAWAAAGTDAVDGGEGAARMAVLLTNRPAPGDFSIPANLVAVRFPFPSAPHFAAVAPADTGALLTLTRPPGDALATEKPLTITVHPVAATGQRVADAAPLAIRRIPPLAPGEQRRVWLDIPALAAPDATMAGYEISIPAAWPSIRAVARWRLRVGLLAVGDGPPLPADFAAWLAAAMPLVAPISLDPQNPASAGGPLDAVIVVGRSESSADFVPGAMPVAWQMIPAIFIGAVNPPANPFAEPAASLPAIELGARRWMLSPTHPLMAGVDVAQLPMPSARRVVAALDALEFRVLIAGVEAAANRDFGGDMPADAVPILVAMRRANGQRGVWLTGDAPVEIWPRAGMAGAVAMANALAWVLDEPRVISAASAWRAGEVGSSAALPPWLLRRLGGAAILSLAWRPFGGAATVTAVAPNSLPERQGWLVADWHLDSGESFRRVVSLSAADFTPDFTPGAPPSPVPPASVAAKLPASIRAQFSPWRLGLLLASILALAGFIALTVRRRH